jgi:hypothetical protein
MKISPFKLLMIVAALLALYVFVGHDLVRFYASGKAEILEAGNQISVLCNAHGACPTTLEGWEPSAAGTRLAKGSMRYYVDPGEESKGGGIGPKNQTIR